MKIRVWFKIALKRLRLAALVGLIEFCRDCGIRQPLVWHAADELWAEVRGRTVDDEGGVLCPVCFDRRAWAKGMLLMWTPVIEHRRDAIAGEVPE